ncbi:hypothetical protein [Haloterrigena alkaliphila]|uniref:Uncharacterized protein n=1 Tax=Haloterrigena alkaliphila TaxID=2816475 RepID=A0A8A2VGG2_9EURY|nr:hypothetical protein [Haloterrigena alkaliphila]QSX01150.1 hypothetical protein J0X25_06745 [Haloterrigena alkaliphila]
MWQDFVFLAGSVLSITFLAPTVRDPTAQVPLGSSVPSMTVGAVYSFTYATMGMTFSAAGSLGVATMWSLIACYRSPGPLTGPRAVARFVISLPGRARRSVADAVGIGPTATADVDQAAD